MLVKINESGSTRSTDNVTVAVIYRCRVCRSSTMICRICSPGSVTTLTMIVSLCVILSTVAGLIRHLFEQNSPPCSRHAVFNNTYPTQLVRLVQLPVYLIFFINGADSRRVFKVAVRPTHGVSDHDLVTWLVTMPPRCRYVQTYSFRSMKKATAWQHFRSDVYCSKLFTAPENTADGVADQMDVVVTQILDKHCPVQTRSQLTPILVARIDVCPRKQSTESISDDDSNESGKLRRELTARPILHTTRRAVTLIRQSLTREAGTTKIGS